MRVLVVSHPSVVAVNQAVYVEMERLGHRVDLVVPHEWIHDYSPVPFAPPRHDDLRGGLHRLRIAFRGRPQRHVYLRALRPMIRELRPDAAFVEEESFSTSAHQWARALHRCGVPFGVQADENLDRRLPLIARWNQRSVLRRCAFVAARSPRAGDLISDVAPEMAAPVIPHAVPEWQRVMNGAPRPFTVGYAGRLIPEKGIADLVQAVHRLEGEVRLLLVGAGSMVEELEGLRSDRLEIIKDARPDAMPHYYAQMDVLVLPSRTTATWAEQFGRVLVEALWCEVPVIGSDSGEIPWVVQTTGGGRIFREGDVEDLVTAIDELRRDPGARKAFARAGRSAVEREFAAAAVARKLAAALHAAVAR